MSKEKGRARVLTTPEFKRVIKMQSNTKFGLRNTVLMHLSFYLGLRAKEMCLLTVGSITDSHGALKTEVLLKRKMTKGNKQRRFYLTNDKLTKILMQYMEQRKVDETDHPDAPLILSQKGGRFSPNSMQQLFSKFYRMVGLDGASSHSGRRSFCTRLLEQGVGIRNVQTLMGHSSIGTTAIYAEENPVLLGKISGNLTI
jgi:integrase/recombinase XerD